MIVKEFRIVLPMTVEEYQVGLLWSVAEASKAETGGGEGVEILHNRPYDGQPLLNGRFSSGQYTYKVFHVASKVPAIIRFIMPKGSLEFHEEAWNSYPYCRTVYSNPGYMKEKMRVTIESMHLPDDGSTENAHELGKELLGRREVVHLDIADDKCIHATDYDSATDPKTWKSTLTGRGPLEGKWISSQTVIMCAYKLVTVEFVMFGFQTGVERYMTGGSGVPRYVTKLHREMTCWMDKWHALSMEDIREMEERVKQELNEARAKGDVVGMKPHG